MHGIARKRRAVYHVSPIILQVPLGNWVRLLASLMSHTKEVEGGRDVIGWTDRRRVPHAESAYAHFSPIYHHLPNFLPTQFDSHIRSRC